MQYQTAEANYSNIIMNSSSSNIGGEVERVIERMAGESAVVIFSVSSCCMCHAIKRLLCGMGVNPTVHELDLLPAGHLLHSALLRFAAGPSSSSSSPSPSPSISQLPLVFVGGKLLGAMDRVMASHINGTLVPLLKDAGALWL